MIHLWKHQMPRNWIRLHRPYAYKWVLKTLYHHGFTVSKPKRPSSSVKLSGKIVDDDKTFRIVWSGTGGWHYTKPTDASMEHEAECVDRVLSIFNNLLNINKKGIQDWKHQLAYAKAVQSKSSAEVNELLAKIKSAERIADAKKHSQKFVAIERDDIRASAHWKHGHFRPADVVFTALSKAKGENCFCFRDARLSELAAGTDGPDRFFFPKQAIMGNMMMISNGNKPYIRSFVKLVPVDSSLKLRLLKIANRSIALSLKALCLNSVASNSNKH